MKIVHLIICLTLTLFASVAHADNYPFREGRVSGSATVTDTTETTLVAAGVAGVFNDLEVFFCSNTSASVVRVDVRDATGGAVIFPLTIPANDSRGVVFGSTRARQTTAASAWTIKLSTSVTDVRCFAQAMKQQ